jgi:hypothetical protein
MGRLVVVMFSFLAVVAGFSGSARAELRAVPERPGIFEIGDPVMINKTSLEHEMRLNANLASFIENYGWPDYAEIQEVQVDYPFAPYEVRIYYLRRNSYMAYGRVIVAPSVFDYGIRKYEGDIRPETLDRLLTVAVLPEDDVHQAAVVQVDPQPVVYEVHNEAPAEAVEAEVVEAEVVEAAPAPAVEEPVVVAAAAPATDRTLEQIIQRLEAAAERAAAAADMAEQASLAANSSADRATTALERAAAQVEAR